jgi:hypothetical protein
MRRIHWECAALISRTLMFMVSDGEHVTFEVVGIFYPFVCSLCSNSSTIPTCLVGPAPPSAGILPSLCLFGTFSRYFPGYQNGQFHFILSD